MLAWCFQPRICLASIAAMVLVLSATPCAIAAPGDLDPTFGGDGIVTTDFGSTFDRHDSAGAVVMDSAGRIVVAGGTNNTQTRPDIALVRYLEDGTLDTTFGIGGKVITDFGSQEPFGPIDVTIDSVGRILVASTTTNYFVGTSPDFIIGRYLPNGSLDPAFGTGGKVILDIGGLSQMDLASAVTVDSVGRILVVGCHEWGTGQANKYTLVRLLDNGTLDPGFGTAGVVIADIGPGPATSVMLDAVGRIVVGGPRLARFLPDGTLDSTFGVNGWLHVEFPNGRTGEIYAATLDGSDRILVAGSVMNEYYGSRVDFAVARYSSDGSLDNTFGTSGWVSTDFLGGYGRDDYASAVAVDMRGRIVVSGHTYPSDGSDYAVARYLEDGTLDPAFGCGGKVTTDFGNGNGNYDFSQDVVLDSIGRIIVVGEADLDLYATGRDFAVARYQNHGVRITAVKKTTEGTEVSDWAMTLAGPEPNAGTTRWDGCITWPVTQPGVYTLTEEDRAGWTPQGAVSVDFVVVPGGESHHHTFVNFENVPVTVCKQDTRGPMIEDWLMMLAGPDPKSGRTQENGCLTWMVTMPGDYTVIEEERPRWTPQGPTAVDLVVTSGSEPFSHTFVNQPPTVHLPLAIRARRMALR